ncbi:histidine phosphatase family protein [Desulfolutivibrio sulfoxidireducens]|nr:histidine phosphatase family protein [Desulfolutivibrio sulfoxidireducens]QLA21580.1 histidine phosphatase family protein [Desulfolutivibrio sulfoxidireducens]
MWLLRHGALPQVFPRRFVGQSDISLSEDGREQAVFWAKKLAGVPFASAVASDISRSLETARIILAGRDVPLRTDVGLREICLGAWEGLTVAEVRERFPGQYEARGEDIAGYRPAGGESFRDVRARAVAALEAIVRQARGEVLVVAHGGVNRCLLCHLLGMSLGHLFRLGQDYACLNLLDFSGDMPTVAGMNIRPGHFF